MKYYEYTFRIEPWSEMAADVLSALLADAGFETFMPDNEAENLKAYIQQQLCEEAVIDTMLTDFPLPAVSVSYQRCIADDRDWNEEWEKEGFEPIEIDDHLLICDTHHIEQYADRDFTHTILIHPRQAFGTGTHETTRMLLRQLMSMPLADKRIIDAGCGTGILSFLCLMLQSKFVFAYDIDEWSTENTYANATLNFTNDASVMDGERLQIELGDSSCLEGQDNYDLLIANINRNILLSDMPNFSKALRPTGAHLLLSGFYRQDVPSLLQSATSFGFQLQHEQHDGDWTMLLLQR